MRRVWDPFLTEQDKAHLALRERPRKGFGERPALLLIDLYRAVFGDYPQPLLEIDRVFRKIDGMKNRVLNKVRHAFSLPLASVIRKK